MSRAEFMKQLEAALSRVPKEERENAIAYYNEYFEEAGKEQEGEIIKSLGSPQRIASQIIAGIAVKKFESDPMPSVKKGVSAIWLVILSIFAAPVALPIAIAIAACIFAFAVTITVVIFAMLLTVIAAFLAGIACVGVGFSDLVVQPLVGIGVLGLGSIMIGVSLLAGMLVVLAARAIFVALAKTLSKVLNRKSKGGV